MNSIPVLPTNDSLVLKAIDLCATKALLRTENASSKVLSEMKKVRSAHRATNQQNVETILALRSALATFDLNIDHFQSPSRSKDPMLLSEVHLRCFDLLSLPTVIFLSDREGSQSSGRASGKIIFRVVNADLSTYPTRPIKEM